MFTYSLIANSQLILRSDGLEIPPDPINADYAAYLAWLAAGNSATQVANPTQAVQIAALKAAIQQQLDATAQAHDYDNIVSACSYAAQPANAPFQAEGAAFLAWRSNIWATAHTMVAQVEAGAIAMPTIAEALADLPIFVDPSSS